MPQVVVTQEDADGVGDSRIVALPPGYIAGLSSLRVGDATISNALANIATSNGTTAGLFIKAGRSAPYDVLSLQGYDSSHPANMAWFDYNGVRKWYQGYDAGNYDFCLVSHRNTSGVGSTDVLYVSSYDLDLAQEVDYPAVSVYINHGHRKAAFMVGGLGDNSALPSLLVDNQNVGGATAWLAQFANNATVKSGVYYDGSMRVGGSGTTAPSDMLEVTGLTSTQGLKLVAVDNAYIANKSQPRIYASFNGGSAPFDTSGHLILQPRSDSAGTWDIIFATVNSGTTPTEKMRVRADGSVSLFGANSWGGGTGVLGIGACLVAPSSNPSSVVLMYVQSSVLKLRVPGGATGILSPGRSVKADTYSASITPDCDAGESHTITATNGLAFTINNPTSPLAGRVLRLDIKNSSGGAMGTITWGAAFLLAGSFTNPADTKRRTITFYYDGTNWVETGRSAADI